MNCEQAEELLAAHALDALADAEAAELRAHLAGCAEHAAKARDLAATARRLSAAADAAEPPPALRARVLDAIARTTQDAASGAPARDRAGAQVAAAPSARENVVPMRRRIAPAWLAVAAVFVAAIVGLAAWNVVLQTRGGGGGADVQRLASRATSISPLTGQTGGSAVVVYWGDEKKAMIVANDVPSLGPASAYQLWSLRDGKATSLGMMPVHDDGSVAVVVPFDAAQTHEIAVTIEPPGGSAQPTSAPVMSAKM